MLSSMVCALGAVGDLLLCPEGGPSSPLHKGMDAEVLKTASAPAGKLSLLPQIDQR